jgi:DNA-binding LytR/AlgR family response regulator
LKAARETLVSDILLPSGTLHGIAIAAMVQVHHPDIPVIFVTGYAGYVDHVPPDATVLLKPVPNDLLLATVAASL